MTFAYLAVSAFSSAENCSGADMNGYIPWLFSVFLLSGRAMISEISAPSLSTIWLGVPAGAKTPSQVLTSKVDKPASVKVGTSGRTVTRDPALTASALSLPVFA